MGNILAVTKGKYNSKDINLEVVLDSNRRPLDLFVYENDSIVGNIYIGRVEKIIGNINAAFVRISRDMCGFLPLDKAVNPIYVKKESKRNSLCTGDIIVVSVIRDKIKTKEVTLSTIITLHSEYFVIDSSMNKIGVSKKIKSDKENEIRNVIKEVMALYCNSDTKTVVNYNITARTISNNGETKDLHNDLRELINRYESLYKRIIHSNLYTCITSSNSHIIDSLKKFSPDDFDKIITDSSEIYEELIKHTSNSSLQSWNNKIELYNDSNYSMWKLYSIETILDSLCKKKVNLKSGASIIIEQTEALTVIDVNSGKNVLNNKAQEELAFAINIEAASRIALELKLRNISGIIIIDFINMKDEINKNKLLSFLKKECTKDRNSVNVLDYTSLGLVEMTRSKTGPSLNEIV